MGSKMIRTIGVSSLALALTMPGVASADPYIRGLIGYGFPTDSDIRATDTPESEESAKGDLRGVLAVGWRLNSRWRGEVEVSNRYYDYGAIGDVRPSASDLNQWSLMVNGLYDIDFGSDWYEPYVGGGFGWSRVRAGVQVPVGPGTFTDTENELALQGIAGVGFPLTDRITAEVEYRYHTIFDEVAINDNGGSASFSRPASHDIFFGLRYQFGDVGAAPVAALPLATAFEEQEFVAPCDDVPFTVYFAWDSDTLSQQARDTIADAVEQLENCSVTQVEVVGHADRSGSESYNQGLSVRRANAVREEMIRNGARASVIQTEGRGERDPALATNDGVREPVNRRVESTIRAVDAGSGPNS